jgi:pimeloyl-ACP methyl ester carboxylesterase
VAPAVVLLHAFPLDKQMWDGVIDAVVDAGWDVVVPDLRGFGESGYGPEGPDDEPDLALVAHDVIAVLDRVGVQSAAVVGLSMGGYVAMELLRQAPRRVAALALLDTKATADTEEARANRLRVADSVLEAGSTVALARALLPTLLGTTTTSSRPALVDEVRGWVEAADPAGVAWAQRAMAARPDSLDDLRAYRGPALVLWGAEDAMSPRPEQDLMLGALRDGRGVEVPGVGHLSAVEDPAAVGDALVRFLGDAQRAVVAD